MRGERIFSGIFLVSFEISKGQHEKYFKMNCGCGCGEKKKNTIVKRQRANVPKSKAKTTNNNTKKVIKYILSF